MAYVGSVPMQAISACPNAGHQWPVTYLSDNTKGYMHMTSKFHHNDYASQYTVLNSSQNFWLNYHQIFNALTGTVRVKIYFFSLKTEICSISVKRFLIRS